MKRIYLFFSILFCSLSITAQSAWIFNRGDSICMQPSELNNITVTYEKDPSGFFWQNIQSNFFDKVRMPILEGDGIVQSMEPFLQAEVREVILTNDENNYFDIKLKYNNIGDPFNIKRSVIGKNSDCYWVDDELLRGEYGAWVYRIKYKNNYTQEDYEAQIAFDCPPLHDTVRIVTKASPSSVEVVKSLEISFNSGEKLYLPLDSPIKFSFADDETLFFYGDGIDDLILSVFDIQDFLVTETVVDKIPANAKPQTDSHGTKSTSEPRIFVNTGLRINVIPNYLNFGMWGMEVGWNTIQSNGIRDVVIEDIGDGCKYTFNLKNEDVQWTVVCGNEDIRGFDLEVQRYYDAPQEEREALMDFYHATGGDNWTRNDGWGSDLPVNKWYGVGYGYECKPNNITQLHVGGLQLANNNLTGTLPPSLAQISDFGSLNVSNNDLSGEFPEHPLSEIMDKVSNSWELYFGGNNFDPTIPEWAKKHPRFKEFWLNFFAQKESDLSSFEGVHIPAPDINLIDMNGKRHTSPNEYTKNKLTIFYYWATWCPYSPGLNAKLIPAYNQYKNKGLNIIGLVDLNEYNSPHDSWDGVEAYCKEKGITWPNVSLERDQDGNMNWDNVITPWRWWNEGEVPKVFAVNEKGEVVFQSILHSSYLDIIPLIEEMFGPIESESHNYYASTDYSKDGEVQILQTATEGNGIDLVFMGEAFTDKDMENGGKYEQKMNAAMEQFFSYEPYTSLRNRFNVYMVKVVSQNEEFADDAIHAINENNEKAFEYAKKALGEDAMRMMVGVIYNTDYASGRSVTAMYEGDNSFVAYMMDGVSNVLNHEMGGHGVAFLNDEYVEQGMENQSPNEEAKATLDAAFANNGEGANVDWRSDPSEVKWSHFIKDSRYADEGVGVYEGAWFYGHGAYRPTENSMMRYNDCGFNAPSREAIYKRVMQLSESASWAYDYETFVAFDAPARDVYKQARAMARAMNNKSQVVPKRRIESRPPKIYRGMWRDAGKKLFPQHVVFLTPAPSARDTR